MLSHEGLLGELLSLSDVIEKGDFKAAELEIEKLGISANDLLAIQLETMQWANQISN